MGIVRVARKLRFPDVVAATWREEVIGEDECGEWAVLRRGDPVRLISGDVIEFGSDQVFCYPPHGWWVADFWGPELSILVRGPDGVVRRLTKNEPEYVDIAVPAVRGDGAVSFVDLILDVVRCADGGVAVLDQDEWAEAVVQRCLPAEYVARAEAACVAVQTAMSACKPPFDGSAWRWSAAYRGGLAE